MDRDHWKNRGIESNLLFQKPGNKTLDRRPCGIDRLIEPGVLHLLKGFRQPHSNKLQKLLKLPAGKLHCVRRRGIKINPCMSQHPRNSKETRDDDLPTVKEGIEFNDRGRIPLARFRWRAGSGRSARAHV